MIWDGDIAKEASRLRWLESDRQRKREETRAMLQGGLISAIIIPQQQTTIATTKSKSVIACLHIYGFVESLQYIRMRSLFVVIPLIQHPVSRCFAELRYC